MVNISRVLYHDIFKFIYDYIPCIARLEKGELVAGRGVQYMKGGREQTVFSEI
jgi:hypothetical protein